MRDKFYELEIIKHQNKMVRILDKYSHSIPSWKEIDILAIERALQILIKSFIGLARYFIQQKYSISVAKSREAFDELKSRDDISLHDHEEIMRILGFRNILVHDYLEVQTQIVKSVLSKKLYSIVSVFTEKWIEKLNVLHPTI